MKKAFTMIELIFVIVILGILAAVALPKFIGVSSQAHEANLKSFVGTLNRTVGPTLWSKAVSKNGDGNITKLTDVNISDYIDLPKEIDTSTIDWDLSSCESASQYTAVIKANKSVAGDDYGVFCKNGTANHAPSFRLYKGSVTVGSTTAAENNNSCLAGPGCTGQ